MTDVLTLSHKVDENSCLVVLSSTCIIILLKNNILPNYKLFQFVNGKIVVVTFIINVQAIRYIIDVIHQATKYLFMSPIETIGFAYNTLVIVHCVVHNMEVLCQNSFIIYLTPKKKNK